jgi:malate dehydrogenase
MKKVTIIGAGNLGAAIANDIAIRGIADEIVLVDIMKELAEGQAADMQQALPYRNKTKVYSGDYDKITDSDVIVITAGKPRTPEMSDRLQLAGINQKIAWSIVGEIKKYAPGATIITITNPMDVINHFIYKFGFPQEKVIGSGGQLDSSRLRVALGFPEKDVDAWIIGEHGESQIPVFSKIKIDGETPEFSEGQKQEIYEKARATAINVIKKKGATVFAPASTTGDMVQAILLDEKKLMTCSVNLEGEYGLSDVSIGVPVILGANGIEKIEIWDLAEDEMTKLKEAAEKLKKFYENITKPI